MPKISSYPKSTLQSGDVSVIARSGKNYGVDILEIDVQAVVGANVSFEVGKSYFLDLSGMTANRNGVLPAGTAGDEIVVHITDGDDTYAFILIGDAGVTINGGAAATEWSRLFITGETIIFIATSATNWQVIQDGRIPSKGSIEDATGTPVNDSTLTQVALDTILVDIGDVVDAANNRINIRRSSRYQVSSVVTFTTLQAPRIFSRVRELTGVDDLITVEVSGYNAGSYPSPATPAAIFDLDADETVGLYTYQTSGGPETTRNQAGARPLLTVIEQIP